MKKNRRRWVILILCLGASADTKKLPIFVYQTTPPYLHFFLCKNLWSDIFGHTWYTRSNMQKKYLNFKTHTLIEKALGAIIYQRQYCNRNIWVPLNKRKMQCTPYSILRILYYLLLKYIRFNIFETAFNYQNILQSIVLYGS